MGGMYEWVCQNMFRRYYVEVGGESSAHSRISCDVVWTFEYVRYTLFLAHAGDVLYEGVGDGRVQARPSEISRNYVGSSVCFSSPDTPWPLAARSSGAVCLPIARTPCTVNTKRGAQQLERMPVVLARTRHWHTFVVSMTVWALSVLLPAAMEWTPMSRVHCLFVADKHRHYFIICHIALRQAPALPPPLRIPL